MLTTKLGIKTTNVMINLFLMNLTMINIIKFAEQAFGIF